MKLQQILFFKELRFSLKQIQDVLEKNDFDQLSALYSHRKSLSQEWEKIGQLIKTIDKTIKHLKGIKKMKDQEMYQGFNKETQLGYEKYLIERHGDKMKEAIAESHRNIKNWMKADWDNSKEEFNEICKELTKKIEYSLKAGSSDVQSIIRRHFKWIKNFWTPTRQTYAGLAAGYLEPDFQKVFDAYHPQLAKFLAEAMKIFAENELR